MGGMENACVFQLMNEDERGKLKVENWTIFCNALNVGCFAMST